ncbi:hypothetical protein [Clostridium sp.]
MPFIVGVILAGVIVVGVAIVVAATVVGVAHATQYIYNKIF